jgi:hypothetical protein
MTFLFARFLIIVFGQILYSVLSLSSKDSGAALLSRLRAKIQTEPLPIFTFSRELNALVSLEAEDQDTTNTAEGKLTFLECETLFNEYIARLRDFYVSRFVSELQSVEGKIDTKIASQCKTFCVKECRIAMQSSVPPHPHCACWNFDGALVELVEDIEQIVRDKLDLSPGLPLENEENSLPPTVLGASRPHTHAFVKRVQVIWRENKWFRWALSQSALLFVNCVQSEMVSLNHT